EMHGFARAQRHLYNAFTIHEGAVGRIAILQSHRAIAESKLAMMRGNARMIDPKMVVLRAAYAIHAQPQFQKFDSHACGFDEEFGHDCCRCAMDTVPA